MSTPVWVRNSPASRAQLHDAQRHQGLGQPSEEPVPSNWSFTGLSLSIPGLRSLTRSRSAPEATGDAVSWIWEYETADGRPSMRIH